MMFGSKYRLTKKCLLFLQIIICLSACNKNNDNNLELKNENYSAVVLTRGLPKYKKSNNFEEVTSFKLEVSLINQMDLPALEYGCEVTALAMLLSYYGFEEDKNVLQEHISKVPYCDDLGYLGNPDKGFVGDATGLNMGTGVNHGPIAELAKKYINDSYDVIDATGTCLEDLLIQIRDGNPVWIVTTIDGEIPEENDLVEWNTKDGFMYLNKKHHAAVIIGFDENYIFLNNPLGKEDSIKKEKMEAIYKKMGSQSVYLAKSY